MSNCLVCSSHKIEKLRNYRAKSVIFQSMHLFKCKDCDFVFASKMPSDLQLQEYNSEYFKSAHGGHPKSSSAIAFFSGINKLRCEYVSNILHQKNFKASRILEIGPGKGYLASHWLAKYPKSTFYGVETDFTCHEILKKIGVKILLPEQVESSVEEVDLVIISHVLEHVSDPIRFLQTVTQKLKKGGALFIEVPCNDWQHKDCEEPHLLFFNNKSIEKCLKNIGFEQIQVNYFGKSIEKLKAKSRLQEILSMVRNKLIDFGFYSLFAYTTNQKLALLTPIERASTRSFLAHKESEQASWWLRAVSFKL